MIFNMNGGSGGAALNFKVVGGTSAPTSPAENTIWIDTDTEVSGYIFSNKDPNLLDVENWATNIGVVGGIKTLSGGSITLTANNDTCYTSSESELAHIRCTQGKTYVIQWDYFGTGDVNSVQLYPNMDTTKGVWAYADAGKLEYTATDNVTFFSFTFVVSANKTATFSNIRITEKDCAFDTGAVWIHTGVSSPAKFNALKKNGIMVYPIAVEQFVGGTWSSVTAKSYQGGQWVDWTMYLYNKGVEYVDENGRGWAFSGTYTKNANNIRVGSTGGTAFSGYAESPFLNVSGFDTIEIHIITFNTSGSECYGKLSVIDEGGTTVIEHSLTRGMADDSLVSIDVSSINSRCKFRVTAGHTRTGSGRSSYIDFDVVRCC